jgi:ketopantoate reductase
VKPPVVIVGLGQMGGVLAHAFLRDGHPIVPVLRGADPTTVAEETPAPALCVVAVGERDLDAVLGRLPAPWRSRVVLLQNELLPRAWERHEIADPTVCVVWFEKKKNIPITVVQPSRVAGPHARAVVRALETLGVPCREIDRDELLEALVAKNLYILTANVAGLSVGGTVGDLLETHRDLAIAIARDALAIQRYLVDEPLDEERLLSDLFEAFRAEPTHVARGRSAPERLARAIALADDAGLDVPALRRAALG